MPRQISALRLVVVLENFLNSRYTCECACIYTTNRFVIEKKLSRVKLEIDGITVTIRLAILSFIFDTGRYK